MQHPNNISNQTHTGRAGWARRILASRTLASLTYPHGVDRYLEQFDTTLAVNEVRARLVSKQQQTADTVTIVLQPNAGWQGFAAGQYLRLSVDIDGVRYTRCFSPANSAHADGGGVELTCKIADDSVVSRYLADRVAPGEVMRLSQPQGEFTLPAKRPSRILLISAGSGITPVLSMLRTLCDTGYSGDVTFLHYASSVDAQLYRDTLRKLGADYPNVRIVRAYTRGDHGELKGRFSKKQLARAVPDYADAQTYLCGPAGLIEAVQSVYAIDGIADQLHLERFVAAP